MSLKNHPNFHAVQFSVGLIELTEKCLRNKGKEKRRFVATSLEIIELMTDFTFAMEEQIEKEIKDA